jgi:hypothetical protein
MKSSTWLVLLKAVLWFICAFHILVGLSVNLDIGLKEWVASAIYYANVDWNQPQFVYILRPLGAFMITLGIIAGIAARDPLRNQGIVWSFVFLWGLRTLQRVGYWGHIRETFELPARGMLSGTIVVFLSGVILAALLVMAKRAKPEAPVEPAPETEPETAKPAPAEPGVSVEMPS